MEPGIYGHGWGTTSSLFAEAKHTESKNKGHVYFSRYYHSTIEKFKTHDQTVNSYSF